MKNKDWKKNKVIAKISSDWLTIFCESWTDKSSKKLEYWRVEKDSSIIIVSETNDYFILPEKQFRPGINRSTLDFPGGRLSRDGDEVATAKQILIRELSINEKDILSLDKITKQKFIVNSSFNNQVLIVYRSKIELKSLDRTNLILYPKSDYQVLLAKLDCLQCNLALRLCSDLISTNASTT